MNLSNWFAGCQSLEGVNQANCVNGRFLGLLLLAGVNYLQDSLGFLGYCFVLIGLFNFHLLCA